MLQQLNIENSFQRSHQNHHFLIQNNLRSKYVTPQLYNYCMNLFFTFFSSDDQQMVLKYKESVYYRDCCEYLSSYNTLEMTKQKIRTSVLKNVLQKTFYLIDMDNQNHQILLGHVGDKKKLKYIKGRSSIKGIGNDATTVEKLSEKIIKNRKFIQEKRQVLNNDHNRTENSMRNIWELRECLEIMTKKFNQNVNLRNYCQINKILKKPKRKQKENPVHILKKALQKQDLSLIQKKSKRFNIFKMNQHENETNMDTYGLRHVKKIQIKPMKSSSKSQSSKKCMMKSMLGQGRCELVKKRQESEEHIKKYPLTPNPRYNKITNSNNEPYLSYKKSDQNCNFLRSIKNLRKQNKEKNNLLSVDKFLRSKIKSLSPL